MWYVIATLGGVVVGFVLARVFDKRLDKVREKLEEIANTIKNK